MKTYIATLQIEDDIEIVGNIEAVASYTYRDNGTKYAYSETVEFIAESEVSNDH